MSPKKVGHSTKTPRLYRYAKEIVKEVSTNGGNLKHLFYTKYEKKHTNLKGLLGIASNTLQHGAELDEIIAESSLLENNAKLDEWLARVLISELVWGKKSLAGSSLPIQTILADSSLQKVLKNRGEEKTKVSLYKPRYARVNTLKITVEKTIEHLQYDGWQLVTYKQDYRKFIKVVKSLGERQFVQDYHIQDVLVFPPGTDFHNYKLYEDSCILLQDKSSCLATTLLAPKPGSAVLDMCAGPGMKTTHLAAVMNNEGIIYAVERDRGRYETLCNIVKKANATCVDTILKDATKISTADMENVEYILVDPSCSGSGMVNRVSVHTEEKNLKDRLYKLRGFQVSLLTHALSFPNVKRVVYSTCSLHVEENEHVVSRALASMGGKYKVVNALADTWPNRGSSDYPHGKRCLYAKPDDLTNGFFIAVLKRKKGIAVQECIKEDCNKIKENDGFCDVEKESKKKKRNKSDAAEERKKKSKKHDSVCQK